MFWAWLHRFKTDWRILAPVLLVCAGGMAFGWYYYWQVGQFDTSSHRFVAYGWWPLVSDSPNAVALWVAAVLIHKIWDKRWWLLDSLAFTLNLYVGLWTTFVFLRYPETMRTWDWAAVPDNMNPVLFVSHMGMPLLSLVLVHDLRRDQPRGAMMAAVLAFLAAFLFVDYWGPHIHPAPFLHEFSHGDGSLHLWAPWLMVFTALAWLWVVWPRSERSTSSR